MLAAGPDPVDHGGLSGASLDRPALQELLDDVRSGKIDVIVVYKVAEMSVLLGVPEIRGNGPRWLADDTVWIGPVSA